MGNAGSRAKQILMKLLLLLSGTVFALLLTECYLKLLLPYEGLGAARELKQFRDLENAPGLFIIDPNFGFRPALGTSVYNKFGTLAGNYTLEKPEGVTRLLFIGDSVTARGKIIDAIRKLYNETNFEYWNAGVESLQYGSGSQIL